MEKAAARLKVFRMYQQEEDTEKAQQEKQENGKTSKAGNFHITDDSLEQVL